MTKLQYFKDFATTTPGPTSTELPSTSEQMTDGPEPTISKNHPKFLFNL